MVRFQVVQNAKLYFERYEYMNNELISLRQKSFEAEVILKNFATRKRIHKDKQVAIIRLFLDLTRRGLRLNRMNFDQVFMDLEKLGYGIVEKNKFGHLISFLPITNIKSIGLDAMEVHTPIAHGMKPISLLPSVKEIIEVASTDEIITVVVIKNGIQFEAKIPRKQQIEFMKMIS